MRGLLGVDRPPEPYPFRSGAYARESQACRSIKRDDQAHGDSPENALIPRPVILAVKDPPTLSIASVMRNSGTVTMTAVGPKSSSVRSLFSSTN
jgi:hypothetical protein